jgi:exopolysaccharide biosynthesis polyprenyl glycosylphosphotransferase
VAALEGRAEAAADMMPAGSRRVARLRAVPLTMKSPEHRVLLTAGDFVAALAAVTVALWLWSIPAGWSFGLTLLREHARWFLAAGLWVVAASLPANSAAVAFSVRRTAAALARGALVLLAAYAAWYFYAPRGVLPRLVTLYFLWDAALLTLAWRIVFIAVFSAPRFRRRTVVIGGGAAVTEALEVLARSAVRRFSVVAAVEAGVAPLPAGTDAERLPSANLTDSLARLQASEIVLALEGAPPPGLVEQLLACQEAGAEVVRVQTLAEQLESRIPVALLDPDWLLTDLADAMRLREASWWMKRALDLAGAIAGLAIAAVLTPFIAAAIALDSGWPVFYRQERLGRAGTPFRVLKFRTMQVDAERPGEARWAARRDPRVTRVGLLLRRTRLDELPQFWNVLTGDMSLVGPRPERPAFVEQLQDAIPFYRARLMVPPGLTGWAQVHLPYGDSIDAARRKLEYDLYYVKHRSVAFDCLILLRTFGALMRMGGQ